MGLEQDLHQSKPFTNAYRKASVNILFTHGWLLEQMKHWLKPYGITMKQYNVLRILRGAKGPISTCIVKDRMIDRQSDVSRLVDRMVLKGWISKSISEVDKRLVELKIEDSGLLLLETISGSSNEMDKVFSNLSEEEAASLSDLLDKLRG